MEVQLGVAPIAWSNDDLPELGGETPLEKCLAESRLAGFTGTETGGKFPRSADELSPLLQRHGLKLVSGWYSGRMLENDIASEKARLAPQLELFRRLGAPVLVYGETTRTVQNRRDVPLAERPRLAPEEFGRYGEKMTLLARHCRDQDVELSFHHHMGTVVETEEEIDLLMRCTGEEVGLLLDTGHITFAGGDPIATGRRHARRINHVHAKDVRADVLERLDKTRRSFLDAVLEGIFTVPGDGMIDFAAFARFLKSIGYHGWVVVEAEQDPAKANPLDYARIGHRTLTAALTDAGYRIAT